MAIALVSNTIAQGNTSGATTGAIDTSGANLIVIVLATFQGSTPAAISDSKGNTWTGLTAINDGTNRTRIFYCVNPVVGTGHTFTCNGSLTYSSLAASAWSGVATSSPFDVENGATVNSNSLATGSITPSTNGQLLICGGCWGSPGQPTSPSVNNSFVVLDSAGNVSGQSFGILHAYRVQATAAAINPTISWGGASSAAAVSIASFKAAAGGGGFIDNTTPVLMSIFGSAL